MLALLIALACAPGTLPIHRAADGTLVCGTWPALQAYSRGTGAAPVVPLPAGAVTAEGADHYAITRAAVDVVLGSGLGALARQARLEDQWAGGHIVGFKVVGLPATSPFRALGLASGDVLQSVNGLSPSNPLHMLALFALLQSPNPTVSLKITRAKQARVLVWRVVDGPAGAPAVAVPAVAVPAVVAPAAELVVPADPEDQPE